MLRKMPSTTCDSKNDGADDNLEEIYWWRKFTVATLRGPRPKRRGAHGDDMREPIVSELIGCPWGFKFYTRIVVLKGMPAKDAANASDKSYKVKVLDLVNAELVPRTSA